MDINKLEEELQDCKVMLSKIKQDGFYECFYSYSNFEEIKDKQFHSLRKDFLEKGKDLEHYILSKIEHLENIIQENI
jgi:hypothetical protein